MYLNLNVFIIMQTFLFPCCNFLLFYWIITFVVCVTFSIFLFRKIIFPKKFLSILNYSKSEVGKLRSVCIFCKCLLTSLIASNSQYQITVVSTK